MVWHSLERSIYCACHAASVPHLLVRFATSLMALPRNVKPCSSQTGGSTSCDSAAFGTFFTALQLVPVG
jgi:hypothetical protein